MTAEIEAMATELEEMARLNHLDVLDYSDIAKDRESGELYVTEAGLLLMLFDFGHEWRLDDKLAGMSDDVARAFGREYVEVDTPEHDALEEREARQEQWARAIYKRRDDWKSTVTVRELRNFLQG